MPALDVAFEVEIGEQEIDRRRLPQLRQRARRRAGRENLVALFFQIGFSQDADLILIFDNQNDRHARTLSYVK